MSRIRNPSLQQGFITEIDQFIDGGMYLDWKVGTKTYMLSLSIEIDVDMKIMMIDGKYDSMITTYRKPKIVAAAFADKMYLKQANRDFPEVGKPLAMILLGIKRSDTIFKAKVYQYLVRHAKARLDYG